MWNNFRDWLDYKLGKGCNRKFCHDGDIKIYDRHIMMDSIYVSKCPWCEKYG